MKNRNLKRITKLKKLFHISYENHDGECFHPRIPDELIRMEGEDDKYTRVCFSTSMSGCYRALGEHISDFEPELYVHIPINMDKIIQRGGLYKPNDKLVPDVNMTNEHWCRRPVKLKCIGKAKFSCAKKWYDIPPIKIKWIEKYE